MGEVGNQERLIFLGVDIVTVRLDSVKPYDNQTPINVNIVPKVFYPQGNDDQYQILMNVDLSCESFFDLHVVAIGNFEIDPNLDKTLRKSFINLNSPAIMFPYVRSFISTVTTNLGNVTGALVIPSQFFNGDLEEV